MRRQGLEIAAVVAACWFFIATVHSAPDKITNENTVKSLRLPNDTIPLKYRLHIHTEIHRGEREYTGSVDIEIMVKNRTNEIVLHALNLTNLEVAVRDLESGEELPDVTFLTEENGSFLRIFAAPTALDLNPGQKYLVTVNYTGYIATSPEGVGFYQFESSNRKGETIPVATTKFEPSHARSAFPCYDEPALKAHFKLSITHGSNFSAISNMPVVGDLEPSPEGSLTTTRFKKTPLMSTYLLVFIVSNYEHTSKEANGVKQTAYYPPGESANSSLILDNSIASLSTLEQYFGVKYPLEKLDHAFVSYSKGAAMENWGLITYETLLLNEKLERFFRVTQNHEIAHQWFGNLVSPKWWTYTWLNEAFANYYAYIVADLIQPRANFMEKFEEEVANRALHLTCRTNDTKSSSWHVISDKEVQEKFGEISYEKTAVIVRMFHHAMGKKAFDKGLTIYFNRFQYSSADEDDLFQCLQESVNENGNPLFQGEGVVRKIMSSWTQNGLFPSVTVKRNYTSGTLTIQQKSLDPEASSLWWIPLTFATASSPHFNDTRADYIMPNVEEVTIDLKDLNLELQSTDWLIVNVQQTGLYQVIYDDQNWHLIANTLKENPKAFPVLQRAAFFKQATFGLWTYTIPIEPLMTLLNHLRNENEPLVWSSVDTLILRMIDNLRGWESYNSFKTFVRQIVEPMYERVADKPPAYEMYYNSVMKIACGAELPLCLSKKGAIKEDFIKTPKNISQLIEDSLDKNEKNFRVVSQMNAVEEHDFINPAVVEEILKHLLKENDTLLSIRYLSSTFVVNKSVRGQLIDFLLENLDQVISDLTDMWVGGFLVSSTFIGKHDPCRIKFIELLDKIVLFLEKSDAKIYLPKEVYGLQEQTIDSKNFKAKAMALMGLNRDVFEVEAFYANNDDAILNWIEQNDESKKKRGA